MRAVRAIRLPRRPSKYLAEIPCRILIARFSVQTLSFHFATLELQSKLITLWEYDWRIEALWCVWWLRVEWNRRISCSVFVRFSLSLGFLYRVSNIYIALLAKIQCVRFKYNSILSNIFPSSKICWDISSFTCFHLLISSQIVAQIFNYN